MQTWIVDVSRVCTTDSPINMGSHERVKKRQIRKAFMRMSLLSVERSLSLSRFMITE